MGGHFFKNSHKVSPIGSFTHDVPLKSSAHESDNNDQCSDIKSDEVIDSRDQVRAISSHVVRDLEMTDVDDTDEDKHSIRENSRKECREQLITCPKSSELEEEARCRRRQQLKVENMVHEEFERGKPNNGEVTHQY